MILLKERSWIGTHRENGKEGGLNRSVYNEALGEGKSWGEIKQLARNRIRWRCSVDALCP